MNHSDNKVRFNQHPIVSVLLWVLGNNNEHHLDTDKNKDLMNHNSNNNTLKWKDVDGQPNWGS